MRLSLKSSLTGLFGILLLLTLAQGGLSLWKLGSIEARRGQAFSKMSAPYCRAGSKHSSEF